MTNTFMPSARRSRVMSLAALATVGLIALTGCGADSDAATDQQGQGYGQGQGQGQGRGMGGGMPGTSGEIAAIDGSTLQVQGSDAQTAVTYTDETTISQQVSAALADVAVGSCVMVTTADDSESSETAVTAGTVRITEKTDGSCAGGGGFGAGQRPEGDASGAPEGMPSDMPSDMPEGMPSGGPGGMGGGMGTSGEVTEVSDSGFTVAATSRDSEETTSVTVTVGSETTYTTTKTATKSALVVGTCVTATGEADDTGAVTAERISVSDPVEGECTTGFGGRGGMPGGAPGQDGASS
ncbi:hypothetical protein SAMN05428985_106502 [Nocardioides sp. YR527]|uniref:DUF5666 domain-containing protein n=1 Tax=Nocardioides sp. YR527 TaxID=1881028 RepID=UPI00087E0D49|nr:DUF5666 domain-containing protein [Nocardioides sp. YR527]SDK87859.1 hypothetical protein SAMN05428985_106502 [Nocardioides sp. YR527]